MPHLFFGILDRDGNLEYLNAGHPSPLLVAPRRGHRAFHGGLLSGGAFPEADYATARATLESGDTLVLFSDGVTEAADPEEQLFGVPRLCEALTGQHDAPLDQLQKRMVESVENFARGASQADDITLLLVRYGAASQTAKSGA